DDLAGGPEIRIAAVNIDAEVIDDDLRPGSRQRQGDTTADAAASAGYDCNSSVEHSHDNSPVNLASKNERFSRQGRQGEERITNRACRSKRPALAAFAAGATLALREVEPDNRDDRDHNAQCDQWNIRIHRNCHSSVLVALGATFKRDEKEAHGG